MYTPLIKKRTGRYGNNHWLVFSPKLKRDVNLFSDLELDNWVLIETDSTVVTFCEQPWKAEIEGEKATSIFDMWYKRADGSEIFMEIKYEKDLEEEDVVEQVRIQKTWCEINGKEHLVRTEKEIRHNKFYLENLKEMIPYVLNSNDPVEVDRYKVNSQLVDGKKTIGDLSKVLDIALPRLYEAIYCMIYAGEVKADLETQYFGLKTEVWIDEKKELT